MFSNKISFFLPDGSHLPPPHLNSPLKRKRSDLTARTANVASRKILFSPAEKKHKISIKKEIPFLTQEAIEKQPKSIRLQLDIFQRTLQQIEEPVIRVQINNIITKILNEAGLNEKDKLVELGILHYYLASHKELPILKNETFLEHRIGAIYKEAYELENKHEKHSTKSSELKLPSGCTAYLMRAMCRMIFPPDGAFNLGGCYAVLALLESHINEFLSDEMRAQILNITQRFIDDEKFRLLFQEPFQVHPQMEELIHVDLKLPVQEKMSFIYVRWCLVTALFSPIGQNSGKYAESNCYAVSVFMNLLKNSPESVVQLMAEALRKGSFSYEGVEIPISLLMESRCQSQYDFNVAMTADRARGSAPYLTTISAFEIPVVPKLQVDQQRSLGVWIDNDFSQNTKLAKNFFTSHRVSFLQQMVLSILQFCSQNSLNIKERKSTKVEFLNKIMRSIKHEMDQLGTIPLVKEPSFEEFWDAALLSDDFETYFHEVPQLVLKGQHSGSVQVQQNPLWQRWFSEFTSSLMSSVFCLDYTHWDLQVERGKVVFNNHSQGFLFNGNLSDYEPFKATRRVLHFSSQKGIFKPVDRLSGFAELCVEHLEKQAASPHALADASTKKEWYTILHRYLKSPEFLSKLAHLLESYNKKESSLSWEEYFKADSLFLIQDGGFFNHTIDLPVIREKFQHEKHISSLDIGSCFIEICQWVASKEPQRDSYILAGAPLHMFNIVPSLFQRYLEDPFDAVQTHVIAPGVKLLYKQLSFQEMERVLKITLGAKPGELFAQKHFNALTMSCLDFARRAEILLKLEPEKYITFKSALNHVTQSFHFREFKQKLASILTELNLPFDNLKYNELVFEMKERKEQSIFTPIQGAYLLQSTLTAMLPSIFVSKFRLEEAIRTCFNFPQVVLIGNLNWINEKAEKPTFDYLTLRYDIGEMRVVFVSRKGKKDNPFSKEESDNMCKSLSLYFDDQ